MATDPTSLHPKKKIIICCDGTGCTGYKDIKESPLTNVSRISRCIKPVDLQGTPQVVYYQSGVGTSSWSLSNTLRQGLGIGLDEKIIEAYSFICHNYTECGDEIYLIGFSRGAFIVRCIASLTYYVGLLTKTGLFRLPEVFERWKKISTESDHLQSRCRELVRENSLRRDIRIKACAVWDTVSSIGIPRPAFLRQPPPSTLKFVNSDLCPGIDCAFQALSLHEHRRHFLPIVWRFPRDNTNNNQVGNQNPDRLEQCWFMGYHSDIGGGNENECLAHFALIWILSKLQKFLYFDEENFWKPGPEKSSWRLSLAESDECLTGFIVRAGVDHISSLYWLGGSKHRKPRSQFWGDNGLMEIEPPHSITSNERMHLTVRLLAELNALPTCSSLGDTQPPQSNPWVWELQQTADPAQTYEVCEGLVTKAEKRLLENWLNTELDLLHQRSEAGDAQPQTAIPCLQDWLWTPGRLPVPVD